MPPKRKSAAEPRPSSRSALAAVDAWFQLLAPSALSVLQGLLARMERFAPGAERVLSYGLPALRWRGRVIGGLGSTKAGASYYPFSGRTLTTLAPRLKGFSRTKSALHFELDRPLSEALLRALVRERMREVLAAEPKSPKPTRPGPRRLTSH